MEWEGNQAQREMCPVGKALQRLTSDRNHKCEGEVDDQKAWEYLVKHSVITEEEEWESEVVGV